MSRRRLQGRDLGGASIEVTPDEMMDQLREVSGRSDAVRVVTAFADGSWFSIEWPAKATARLRVKGVRDGR